MGRPILKRIHVNSQRLRANRKLDRDAQPVVSVRTSRGVRYGFIAEIKGPSKVVYRPEKPLSCGAVLWVETRAPVLLDDTILIQ